MVAINMVRRVDGEADASRSVLCWNNYEEAKNWKEGVNEKLWYRKRAHQVTVLCQVGVPKVAITVQIQWELTLTADVPLPRGEEEGTGMEVEANLGE